MNIYKDLNKIEKGFNIAGSIPFIGVLSGSLRVAAAEVQAIAGLILTTVGLLGQLIHNNFTSWKNLTYKGLDQVKHAAMNVLRGVGEMLLSASIIGSIVTFSVQYFSSNGFEPRHFKYESQTA